ncbi:MAG: choice-of-anchor D domain-containing protein, partial [Candidatus Hatepunaea meridiana]|nr:choice-of-anchor D domain-containing protein [Candidatus Hatepunaea meridiana]
PLSGTGVGAIIVVDPDTVQFGEVGLNRAAEAAITIRNIGQLDLNVSDIVVEGGGFLNDFDEEFSIEPDHSRDISVTFAPERSGLCSGIMIIASDDRRNDELVVPLFGTGVGPRIAVDQDSLEFGLLSVGRSEIFLVTISAIGLTDLTITDISIEGDNFHTNFDGEEIFIQLNHRYQIVVTFEPEDDGLFDGVLTITSDDEDHPQVTVHLSGSAFKGVLNDTPGLARGVFVDGSYAYIADDEAGLRIIGIFDPEAPNDVGGFDTPGNALSVTSAENNVFIADGVGGLRIIDVSSPQEPEELVAIETPGEAWDVAIVEDYAYIADGDSGLRVIDIYDLERPVEVGSFDTPGFARAVTIVGNFAYIADDNRGLQILDISEPEHISETGSYDTRGWTWDVAVSGEYAYLADERYGLRIIDISDPENPEEVSNLDTDADAYSVTVDGDYVYVADGEGGVCVIHVGDPENPRLVDTFYTPSCAWDVCISGNYAFVADGGHGLLILDAEDFVDVELEQNNQLPSEFILYEVYPNPFNATTTITYGLPSAGVVSLGVYDLSGRKIATLMNGKMNSGIHKLDWKAVGQTSGVYIVRLETYDVIKTQKVILLR